MFTLLCLVFAAPAMAATAPAAERTLTGAYSPVMRLVAAPAECGPGDPYVPIDVNLLFDEPTVALRGPWGGADLIKVAPTAADLAHGLYEYHLDFPGDALNPGVATSIGRGGSPPATCRRCTPMWH